MKHEGKILTAAGEVLDPNRDNPLKKHLTALQNDKGQLPMEIVDRGLNWFTFRPILHDGSLGGEIRADFEHPVSFAIEVGKRYNLAGF